MISRRTLLALPFAAACTRSQEGFRGYAFIANQEGGAIAAVDLGVLAVARHIPLAGAPTEVTAAVKQPTVYALTPDNGSVHEIQIDTLRLARKLMVASQAITMALAADERQLFVLARSPRALVAVALDSFKVDWRLPLPDEPVGLAISPDGKNAAISSTGAVYLVDLAARRLSAPLGHGDYGPVQFLTDSKTLMAGNRGDRLISAYSVVAQRLITHLPIAVRPDQFCFSSDGGQLFVTGEGMDAVVVVYPFFTPEVGDTVLAGHAPGAMGVSGISTGLLFVASPQSGDVSILSIATRKVIAVLPVGSDPGYIRVTPDDQYALVLNRKSGDMAVLSVPAITQKKSRYSPRGLLTVIPVGSRPVSAVVRAV